jgi:PAS domain S-box-containing protein
MVMANSIDTNSLSTEPYNKTKLTLINGLLIFVVYFILSKTFMSFSIDLGIPFPIMPGAGFAIVSYLVFGVRGLIPISLAIISSSIMGHGILQWHYFPVSLFFALGALLQAVVCGFMIKVKKVNLNSLNDIKEIGSFFILSVLVSLISATISNVGLHLVGVDEFTQTDVTFLTCWFGECIGIFIFTPFIFWCTRKNKSELDKKQIRIALISLSACIILISVAFFWEKQSNEKKIAKTYKQELQSVKSSIEHKLEHIITTSKLLSSYMHQHNSISNDDFLHYTKIALQSNENIVALSWNPLIEDENRALFEDKLSEVHKGKYFISVKDNIEMKRANKNSFYIPVYLISPIESNEKTIGFDVYSNSTRREALDKAIQLGVSVATKPLRLVQNQEHTNSILIFHPVEKYKDTISENGNNHEKIAGFVTSVINVERLVTNAIVNLHPNLHQIEIIEQLNKTSVFSSDQNSLFDESKLNIKNLVIREEISFAENNWLIEARPKDASALVFNNKNQWLILYFGVFVTTIFYAMVLFWSGRQKVIEGIVEQQTNEINSRKKHLSLTLSSIADAVIATNVNCIITDVNSSAEKLLGMDLSAQSAVHIDSLFALLSGVRANVFDNASANISNNLCIIDSEDYVTLNRLDGTSRQVFALASPITDDKNLFQGIVFILKDISEIQELKDKSVHNFAASEAKYKALILSSNTGAWEYFIDDNYLSCSKEYFSMLGRDIDDYKSQDKNNIAELWSDLIHHEDRERSIKLFSDYLKNPQGMYENNFRMRHKDGSWVWIISRGHILKDINGDLTQRTIGTHINITSQIEMQKKLKHSQKMDALGKLTGGVAHDYNNMLAVIQGYAELLIKKSEPTSKEFRYVKEILKASSRGANLTEKLLSFVKKQQDNKEGFSLNDLVLEQLDMLHKALTARIQISLNFSNETSEVLANKNDLVDVLLNLCINSMHAIENNGSITLSTGIKTFSSQEAELYDITAGKYVTLAIEDDGCGMNDLTLSKIFDPFFTTKGEHGTGLGLSQVYGFAKSNHGGITVTSELGKGTKITIYLPSRKINENNIPLLNNDDTSDITVRGNILIVDDELSLLDLAFEFLTSQGYNVKTAQNAENAMKILGSENIDLVVTDIIMPKVDGYQLANLIKESAIATKITFVSGYNDESVRQKSDFFSQISLLRKPYTGKELISFVHKSLNEE